jgi:hypothetical protein
LQLTRGGKHDIDVETGENSDDDNGDDLQAVTSTTGHAKGR